MPADLVEIERVEATRLYNLIKGDEATAAILTSITKMDFASAKAFKEQYEVEADGKFPQTCGDCSSTNISRASASVDPGSVTEDKKILSNKDAKAEMLSARSKDKKSVAIGYNK